jgi:uncharacterized tellurite resistance protein B-like protein
MSEKQLFKVLIAVAWIDGEIQPQENDYLKKMVTDEDLFDDPEIKSLLSGQQPPEVLQGYCLRWMKEYLDEHPTPEDRKSLVAKIGALIYSDGHVGVREADLLESLEKLEPSESFSDKFLKIFGKFGKNSG